MGNNVKLLDLLVRKIRDYDATRGYTCDACGRELFEYPEKRLCDDCSSSLRYNDGYTCQKCGRKTVTESVCLTCKQILPPFTKGFSPLDYSGKSAALVNRLKNGDPRLALFLGERMTETFLSAYTGGKTEFLLLPVPLSKERKRIRGYNQAELLCESILRGLEERSYTVEYARDLLIKKENTESQKDLHYKERFETAEKAYTVANRQLCKGKTALLIDDICTTGATGGACAKKLLSAGAEEVFFLSAASLAEIKRDPQ